MPFPTLIASPYEEFKLTVWNFTVVPVVNVAFASYSLAASTYVEIPHNAK
jgi:hypothetical protein